MSHREREAQAAIADGQVKAAVRQAEQAAASRELINRLNWLVGSKGINLFGLSSPDVVAMIFYHYQDSSARYEYQVRQEIGWQKVDSYLSREKVIKLIEHSMIFSHWKIDVDYRFQPISLLEGTQDGAN